MHNHRRAATGLFQGRNPRLKRIKGRLGAKAVHKVLKHRPDLLSGVSAVVLKGVGDLSGELGFGADGH